VAANVAVLVASTVVVVVVVAEVDAAVEAPPKEKLEDVVADASDFRSAASAGLAPNENPLEGAPDLLSLAGAAGAELSENAGAELLSLDDAVPVELAPKANADAGELSLFFSAAGGAVKLKPVVVVLDGSAVFFGDGGLNENALVEPAPLADPLRLKPADAAGAGVSCLFVVNEKAGDDADVDVAVSENPVLAPVDPLTVPEASAGFAPPKPNPPDVPEVPLAPKEKPDPLAAGAALSAGFAAPNENPPVAGLGSVLVAPKENPPAAGAGVAPLLAPKENPPPAGLGAAAAPPVAGVPKEKPPPAGAAPPPVVELGVPKVNDMLGFELLHPRDDDASKDGGKMGFFPRLHQKGKESK
jgi:hypothetical protein